MKYDLRYKYLEANIGKEKVVFEFGFDNMLGKDVFSVKSNLLFKDENGDYGHAVGVGKGEKEALFRCLEEIRDYTNCNIKVGDLNEINLLKKLVFEYKKTTYSLYFEQGSREYKVFTCGGTKTIVTEDIVKYVSDNIKEVIGLFTGDDQNEILKRYGIDRAFDMTAKKFN